MSEPIHLAMWQRHDEDEMWCGGYGKQTRKLAESTCLACLLALAELGSEARHRYEVLRESGVKP